MTATIVIALVVTALLRIIPAALWPGDSSDSGYHLLLRKVIREHGMRMPGKVEALALDEAQRYPWLFHVMIAMLPDRVVLRYPALISVLTDGFMVLAAMLLAGHMYGSLVDMPSALPMLAAGLLVASSPAFLAAGVGPRAYEVTPRPVGEMFFCLAMVCGGMFHSEYPYAWLVGACLLMGLALLSSKFTVQVAVFCLPVMSLLMRDVWPAVMLAGGFLVAIVVSRGRYLEVLRGQFHHLDVYRRRIAYDHEALWWRNNLMVIGRNVMKALRGAGSLRHAIFMVLCLLEKSTLVLFLTRNLVWLVAASVYVFGELLAEGLSGWHQWLTVWLMAPLFPFLLTSLRPFLFLGEAERYMEYATIPAAVLVAGLIFTSSAWVAVLLCGGILIWTVLFMSYTYCRMNMRQSLTGPDDDDLVAFLNAQPSESRVLPLSIQLAFRFVWKTRVPFLVGIDGVVWRRDYDKMFWRYPWISTDLSWWIREKSASLLLIDRKTLANLHDTALKYDVNPYPLVFQNDTYEVRNLVV